MERYFTVEEANAALEVIRPLAAEMLELRRSLLERQAQEHPAVQQAKGNGGSHAASRLVEDFSRLEELVQRIQATGALVKDVNSALLDFPALREGREVYLCWRYNEPSVQFWHDIDAGFTGRQEL
jgi:hypothetical protein